VAGEQVSRGTGEQWMEDGRRKIECGLAMNSRLPGYALRFACASTLTLMLITSYFVRCILYTIAGWVSSEILSSILDSRYSILDTRFLILDAGYSILDAGCPLLDTRRGDKGSGKRISYCVYRIALTHRIFIIAKSHRGARG